MEYSDLTGSFIFICQAQTHCRNNENSRAGTEKLLLHPSQENIHRPTQKMLDNSSSTLKFVAVPDFELASTSFIVTDGTAAATILRSVN